MLHESNPHERYHLKTNGSSRKPSIQYAKQQAPGDSSLWPSMNLYSRDPRHQDRQPSHILHLPQTVNKMRWLSSIVTCWNDAASWVRDHNTQRKEPDLSTICPTQNTERAECPVLTFCKTEISLFRPKCKALAESTVFYLWGPNVLPLSSTCLSLPLETHILK